MSRPKKDRIALNIKPEAEVMRKFEAYCDEVGQTKTTAFERIVSAHMDQYEEEKKRLSKMGAKKFY